jgi:hypothetical protein
MKEGLDIRLRPTPQCKETEFRDTLNINHSAGIIDTDNNLSKVIKYSSSTKIIASKHYSVRPVPC